MIHIFFNSALVGSEWSASRSGLFTPGETAPDTHWIGGWVNPRAGLDDVKKRQFFIPSNSEPSVVQPVASCYTEYAVQYHNNYTKCTNYLAPYYAVVYILLLFPHS
jgi:hypothetical protein